MTASSRRKTSHILMKAKLKNVTIQKGDVLLNITGASVARCCVAPEEYLPARVNQHVSIIRPIPDEVDSQYLCYLLTSKDYKDRLLHTGGKGGSTRQAITKVELQEFSIRYPACISEQQRIVAILDDAFEGIAAATANSKQNLKNARELFKSHLDSVLIKRQNDRSKITLSALCGQNIITYGVTKLGEHIDDGIPCLRTSNVRRLFIDTKGMKLISHQLSDQYGRTILRGGEILVNVRGTLGGVAVVPSEMKGWNVSREVAVVPIDRALMQPEYAAYWVASKASQDWLTGVQKGAAYTGINLSDLRNLPVYLPSIAIQQEIVRELDSMLEMCLALAETYQQKLNALAELKQSLLRKAFAGELH